MNVDDVAEDILRAIRQIVRRIAEHSHALSRDAGLTLPQLLCLRAIGGAPEATLGDIAGRVQLSAGTVSRIVDRLVRRGLVERRRGTLDRRQVRLALTEGGRMRYETLPKPLQEDFLARLGALPPSAQREIQRALEQVVTLMGADAIDASPVLTTGPAVEP